MHWSHGGTATGIVMLSIVMWSCVPGPGSGPSGSGAPDRTYHFARLYVLPVLSLGNLREIRSAARQSLVLSFSSRADSVALLELAPGGTRNADRRDTDTRRSGEDTLYASPCHFGTVKRRLGSAQAVSRTGETVHALCADLGYRRRAAATGSLQVATAAGKIWSRRHDSVIWRDSVAVATRLDKSALTPDTIAAILTKAVIRLRDRLP